MATEEHERENLMQEATAMPFRAQTTIDDVVVFVGVRPGGELSVFWGTDPVWQFDRKGQLRRAFYNSRRAVANDGRMYWIQPAERGGQLRLERTELSDDEKRLLLLKATEDMATLLVIATKGQQVWLNVIPDAKVAHDRIVAAISAIEIPVTPAYQGGLR